MDIIMLQVNRRGYNMPGRDGISPLGKGPVRDGRICDVEAGWMMRSLDDIISGSGGSCLCPNCGIKLPHQQEKPCSTIVCPKCGTRMVKAL